MEKRALPEGSERGSIWRHFAKRHCCHQMGCLAWLALSPQLVLHPPTPTCAQSPSHPPPHSFTKTPYMDHRIHYAQAGTRLLVDQETIMLLGICEQYWPCRGGSPFHMNVMASSLEGRVSNNERALLFLCPQAEKSPSLTKNLFLTYRSSYIL